MNLADEFIVAYNSGDFPGLFSLLLENCDRNVRFTISLMNIECHGIFSIIAFFLLLHEIYPDSIIQNIEKRVATIKSPSKSTQNSFDETDGGKSSGVIAKKEAFTPQIETVENIDKFAGTRVLPQPVFVLYQEILSTGILNHTFLTLPMIISFITDKIQQKYQLIKSCFSDSGVAHERLFTFITETNLTFDLPSNRITCWSYNILACHSN